MIDIAPSLFATHGQPTEKERALYDKMYADQMARVDTKELRKEFDEVEQADLAEHERQEADYESSFRDFGPLDKIFFHLDKWINGGP